MNRISICIRHISLAVVSLVLSATAAHASNYVLGTTTRIEGPNAGFDSVALGVTSPSNGTWTASSSSAWIHVNPNSQSGTGSTNVYFSYDQNMGLTRTDTFTVQGMTVTVIQAPTNYIAAALVTNLAAINSNPRYVAVDRSTGNLFISDEFSIWKWLASNGTMAVVAIPDTNGSGGLAVDGSGNLYIADYSANNIKVLPAGGTLSTPLTVVSNISGLNNPQGVALDPAGDIYIADSDNAAVKELPAGGTSLKLVASSGFVAFGIGVDQAGNVYVPDYYGAAILECPAGQNAWETLAGPYPDAPYNPEEFWDPLAVEGDGSGNVFIGDTLGGLREWTAVDNTLSPAFVGAFSGESVAIDSVGYVYNADFLNENIDYLPYAYLDPAGRNFPQRGDAGLVPPVVPSTANLTGPFAPTTDAAAWLTVTVNPGDSLTYQAGFNNGPPRTGHIFLLGRVITITQDGDTYALGQSSVYEPPSAGEDTIDLTIGPSAGPWTAAANASWLHINPGSQSGNGSATIQFSFDANPGDTRTGTLTIGGQTFTVTQVGSTYEPTGADGTLVPGLVLPYGVAVDSAGNVFMADSASKTIKEWIAATDTTITLVSSGLTDPTGVAVDGSDDLFIADGTGNVIYELPNGGSLTPLVTSGLNDPTGLAIDSSGDLFISDSGDNTIYELPSGGSLTVVLSSGLNDPTGIAVDSIGNLFIADSGDNTVFEWETSDTLVPLVTSGLNDPTGVAVNGQGDVFIADTGDNSIYELPYGGSLTFLTYDPNGVAVDNEGNIYFSDGNAHAVEDFQTGFVVTAPISVGANAGSSTLPQVLPATVDLTGPFAPTSDQSWLTISGVTNDVVSFSYTVNTGTARTAHISVLGTTIDVTQSGVTFTLGVPTRLEGPATGSDSVVLAVMPIVASWTASANAAWLHLSASNQSGTGPTNVIFSFDTNPGGTRTGTLTIAGQTLTVTQAGSTYVAAGPTGLTGLVPATDSPAGVGVDPSGNVYFGEFNELEDWTTNNVNNFLYNLPGGEYISGLAVDSLSNVYFAIPSVNAIDEYTAYGGESQVASGSSPQYVAVDSAGNLYFSALGNGAILEWSAATQTTSTLVSGLNQPSGVAVDAAGNVYYADSGTSTLYEWIAANQQKVTLAASPQINSPKGLAVDGAGNVYIANAGLNSIAEWVAASNSLTTVISGLSDPQDVAVDSLGNVYIADTGGNSIQELPNAYVDPTPRLEPTAGGSDSLPVIVPATQNLTGPFTPVSSQSWLTINAVAGGVISFSFPANTANFSRSASITVLGQSIPVMQNGPYSLSTYSRVEGPNGGSDSVILVVGNGFPSWTTSANASWLHVSQAGTGPANVVFSYDYNPGGTRTGTLTIAGETLTVTQAGASYAQVSDFTPLVTGGLNNPQGVAVDASGNVYIADTYNSAIEELPYGATSFVTLASSDMGLNSPAGVAVDTLGNVYIADSGADSVYELPAGGDSLTVLASSSLGDLGQVAGVAVDAQGNVFVADAGNNDIAEVAAGTDNITTPVTGLSDPSSVAVDAADNLYIGNIGEGDVLEWAPSTSTLSTLIPNGSVYNPTGVAADLGGNVYVAAPYNYEILEWTPAQQYASALLDLGNANFYLPNGVAVDGAGDVFVADTGNNAVEEYPYAFVDTTTKNETPGAASDSLSVVLPSTANLSGPFAPTSDSSWLTIGSTANGVVTFSFSANSGGTRTANITLLGKDIQVMQTGTGINPPMLGGATMVSPGVLEFTFTSSPGLSFTVLSTTDLTLPLSQWTVVGPATEVSPGVYQFTSPATVDDQQIFYTVRSP